MSDYINMFKEPLPEKAVEALRKATRLASKPMAKALAAVAATETEPLTDAVA